MCRVDRASRKVGAFSDSESVEWRWRHKRVAFAERQKISSKLIERKVDSAVRGERMAHQKLFEAEAEVEARNWEKRNSDFAFHENHSRI